MACRPEPYKLKAPADSFVTLAGLVLYIARCVIYEKQNIIKYLRNTMFGFMVACLSVCLSVHFGQKSLYKISKFEAITVPKDTAVKASPRHS